jgi:beta-glucosidase
MIGNYAGISSRVITFAEAMAERLDPNTILEYRVGCPLSERPSPALNYTFGVAAVAEVVVAFVGLDPTIEGEEGDAVASHSGGDRVNIELPQVQREFIQELRKHAKKLILVVTGGSAVAIPEEHEMCDAVLYAWYPGCEGGPALADVLFGDVAPSGKMPVTVPRRTADLPAFADYRMQGRTYRFAEVEPLYPFGFGLSYATLRYGPLKMSAARIQANDPLTLDVSLSNPGGRDIEEVVQCYVIPPQLDPTTARATLVKFQLVTVKAGSTVHVQLQLSGADFHQVTSDGKLAWIPGQYGVHVGSASPGARAESLGAPPPATGRIALV